MTTIPTLAELNASIIADIEAELGITIPGTGPSWIRGVAAVLAGKLKTYYLALGDVQKNIFIDTADPESMGGTLQRFGFVKLNRYPFASVAAQYSVTVTTTLIGSVINAQTTFKSDDDALNPGQLYILDDTFTFTGLSGTITLRAIEGGDAYALSIADTLTVTSPIALVSATATVTAETVEPQEAESIEEYRAKGIQAYRLEPQGGAGSDYRLWAADAQGVLRSYPYVVSGNSNQINLYVEATIADSIDGEGTPSAGILADVQAAVEDPTSDRPGRKPLGVFQVNYLPIVVKQVVINIAGFSGITVALQAEILTAMTEYLTAVRPFIGSIDVLTEQNDVFDVNKIIGVILGVSPGSVFGTITLTVGGSLVSTYTFDNGEIPHLNTITYI